MNRIRSILKDFGIDDWILAAGGAFAIVIATLHLVGELHFDVEQLLQIAIVGIGLLMTTVTVQASRQKASLKELGIELEKSVQGRLAVTKIDKVELGVEYAANKVRLARHSIYHASLSPAGTVARWHNSVSRFEKNIREAALANQVKIYYIADLGDEFRLKRVRDILKNRNANRYFVRYIDPRNLSHLLNFMIFDDEEVLLVMSGSPQESIFLAIRNSDIVTTFKLYFDLLWHRATPFDRAAVVDASSDI